ncbi:MAG: M15 family metallopeptidase [Clostridiales bacterium]|nr:M15 family metallopeptidase [Clostridiales bacterium]
MAKSRKKKHKKSYLYTVFYAFITLICIIVILIVYAAVKPKIGANVTQEGSNSAFSDELVANEKSTSSDVTEKATAKQQKNEKEKPSTTSAETTTEAVTMNKTASPGSFYYGVTYRSPRAKTCDVFKHGRTLMLINNDWELPENFKWDLVSWYDGSPVDALSLNNASHDSFKAVDREAYQPLKDLFAAASKAGVPLNLVSAYRSISLQDRLFTRSVNTYLGQGYSKEQAIKKANYSRTFTGTSEHNIGLGFDILQSGNYTLSESFDQTAQFKWLQEHAADYGFILRYPKDKVDVTEIMYEPWHYRYVGVKAAHEIKSKGICFEEYIAQLDGQR